MIISLADAERVKRWKKFHPDRYWEYLKQMGNLTDDGIIRLGPFENIKNCWENEPCFVIACSQALKGIDLDKLNGLHTITVNHLIEDWDKSEFHLFFDERFLEKTTYDLKKYNGTFIQQNNTSYLSDVKTIRVKGKNMNEPFSDKIEEGLYRAQSGIAALHFAIITGANPIYLLGHDSTNENKSGGDHYKDNYTAAGVKYNYNEYENRKKNYYKVFYSFKDRIINVCDKNKAVTFNNVFKTIEFEDIPIEEYKKKRENIKQERNSVGIKFYLFNYPINYENNIVGFLHDNYKNNDYINFMNFINETIEKRAMELAKCSIFIIENDFKNRYYLLEAMASGLAIIVVGNKNDLNDIFNNCGIILKDIDGLTSVVSYLNNNLTYKIKYGDLAKERAKKYNILDISKYYMEHLK